MKERLRRIALFTKSALLTLVIHGILLAALFAGWWWPFSENKIERGSVTPIQAQAISAKEIQQQVEVQKKKIEEQQQIAKNLEELKIKQQQEKNKLEALAARNKEEEKKQQELKAQKRRAEEKQAEEEKRKAVERKNKLAEQKKREEAERKKKLLAEEEKRKEAERKNKLTEQKKREEAERKIAEDALQKRIAAELEANTKADAKTAMSALADRINAKFKSNWVRPSNSIVGLIAIIRVNLSPGGDVLSASVVKSSGNSFFDRSAEIAVKKASPLPFPPQPEFYRHIKVLDLEFNPDDY